MPGAVRPYRTMCHEIWRVYHTRPLSNLTHNAVQYAFTVDRGRPTGDRTSRGFHHDFVGKRAAAPDTTLVANRRGCAPDWAQSGRNPGTCAQAPVRACPGHGHDKPGAHNPKYCGMAANRLAKAANQLSWRAGRGSKSSTPIGFSNGGAPCPHQLARPSCHPWRSCRRRSVRSWICSCACPSPLGERTAPAIDWYGTGGTGQSNPPNPGVDRFRHACVRAALRLQTSLLHHH